VRRDLGRELLVHGEEAPDTTAVELPHAIAVGAPRIADGQAE
jgi:hypothetical protein